MRRPAVGPILPGVAAPLLAALLGAVPACAQTVVGRIVDADAGGGVAGAFVVLADSAGRRRTAVLSDGQGRFLLTAPGPGTYTVRAERIGMTTRTTPTMLLAADDRRSLTLTLAAEAVPLAAIEVSGKRRCELRPGAGAATARVWEEVRKALRISAWARSTGVLQYTLRREERTLQLPSRLVSADTVREVSGTGARPYVSLSPEELRREGYVRGSLEQGYSYWAPDEEVLASDEFLDTHCLQLRPTASTPSGTIALDFRRVKRGGPVDIEGTAWLDARSGELRSIEFSYAGLALPPDAEAGGTVDYRRLPSGAWIVARFRLAFPVMRRTVGGARFGLSGQGLAADRTEAIGLHETMGSVTELREAGRTQSLLREDRGRLGSVAGEVYDSIHGRPLAGARVYLSGTVYAATADSEGRFRIAGLPPGRYAVAFDHPVMDSLPVRPAPTDVTVAARGEATLALAVPGAAELRRRACPNDRLDPKRPLVFGRVKDAEGSLVVRVLWQTIEGEAPRLVIRQEGLDVPVDDAGRFVLCAALPDGRPASLRAVRQTPDGGKLYGVAVQLLPESGGLYRVDLTAPKL